MHLNLRSENYSLGVALPTPYDNHLNIDFIALKNIIEFNIAQGVQYFIVLGTTAETPLLSFNEKVEIARFVAEEVSGRVPLVLGLGGINPQQVCQEYRELPTDAYQAVLCVTPYYIRPSQEGLFAYYQYLNMHIDMPIVAYNVPARTGVHMQVETVLRIANELDKVIAIKEASGDLEHFSRLIDQVPSNFAVISGDDSTAVYSELLGAHGVISVAAAAIPDQFSKMMSLARKGERSKSIELFNQLEELIACTSVEGNPTGIKAVLNELELCSSALRIPLIEASSVLRQKIKTACNEIKLFSLPHIT